MRKLMSACDRLARHIVIFAKATLNHSQKYKMRLNTWAKWPTTRDLKSTKDYQQVI